MANESTIFFREVKSSVLDEVKRRQGLYATEERAPSRGSLGTHGFATMKVAFATVKTSTNNDRANPSWDDDKPTANTLGFQNKHSLSQKGYKNSGGHSGRYYEAHGGEKGYVPNTILTGVNIETDGTVGVLRRAKVTFTVYTLGQLETAEDKFLVLGKPVKINYGWSTSSSKANRGEFIGIIHNFGYSVRSDGGFDCSFDAVGEGWYAGGYNPLGGDDESVTDPTAAILGGVIPGGMHGAVKKLIVEKGIAIGGFPPGTKGGDNTYPICMFELNRFKAPPVDAITNALTGVDTASRTFFISMGGLFDIINKKLKSAKNRDGQETYGTRVNFKYDECYGHGNAMLRSAVPNNIMFPGKDQGDYSFDAVFLSIRKGLASANGSSKVVVMMNTFQDRMAQMQETYTTLKESLEPNVQGIWNFEDVGSTSFAWSDDKPHLKNILVSYDFIKKIDTEIAKAQSENGGEGSTIAEWTNKLFNEIRIASGGVYDLTLVIDYDDDGGRKDTTVHVLNRGYNPSSPGALVFYPFKPSSVVRNVNLSAQIPSAMAAEAYVAGRSQSYPPIVAATFSNQESKDFSDPFPNDSDAISFGNSMAQLMYSQIAWKPHEDPEFRTKHTEHSEEMILEMPRLKTYLDSKLEKWNRAMVLPLKFDVTLDGINGFRFGDVVVSDYMPKKYKAEPIGGGSQFKIAFTVGKVQHSITPNDWTTKLETFCRMAPAGVIGKLN